MYMLPAQRRRSQQVSAVQQPAAETLSRNATVWLDITSLIRQNCKMAEQTMTRSWMLHLKPQKARTPTPRMCLLHLHPTLKQTKLSILNYLPAFTSQAARWSGLDMNNAAAGKRLPPVTLAPVKIQKVWRCVGQCKAALRNLHQ